MGCCLPRLAFGLGDMVPFNHLHATSVINDCSVSVAPLLPVDHFKDSGPLVSGVDTDSETLDSALPLFFPLLDSGYSLQPYL